MLLLPVRLAVAAAATAGMVAGPTPPSVAPVVDVMGVHAGSTAPQRDTRASADDRAPQRHATASAQPRRVASSAARQVLRRMTLPQRVGQLFMVGSPATAASPATLRQVGRFHVGNVMLTGRGYAGTRAPARVAAALQARTTRAATAGVRLLVATDQEGGDVQVLHGPGLSEMPTGLAQGRLAPQRLQRAAGTWARQLRAAGVNMDLAPVADTVPSPAAAVHNPPVGAFDREFGFRPSVVGRHAIAFARGMSAQGVVPTVKHFPGLGRVHANTDAWTRVTDRVTGRHDAYLEPFRRAIDAGVPAVMMSTAYYTRLDPHHPAAFSPFVIRTLLRGELGFGGVVVSDDLGTARQVSPWTYGDRAVRFVRAGGDLVLTVDPGTLPAMYAAVLHRARTDRAFRAQVDASALRVLDLKADRHLLGR